VHVVSYKAIRVFCARHPEAREPLDRWYRIAKRADWAHFAAVKHTFNSADFVSGYIVFDIGGNKYRLISEMNFRRKVLFIRHVLTHREYDQGAWKR
jgi:mRNA interferase HigB